MRELSRRLKSNRMPALLLGAALAVVTVAPLEAQHCSVLPGGPPTSYLDSTVAHPKNANCLCTQGCAVGYRCYKPEFGGLEFEISPPGCDPNVGTCTVMAKIPMVYLGNSQSLNPFGGGGPRIDVHEGSTLRATCGATGTNDIASDEGTLVISRSFNCNTPPADVEYQVTATACANSTSCSKPTTIDKVPFEFTLMSTLLCTPRKDYPCQGQTCPACVGGAPPPCDSPKCSGSGGGASAPAGGGGASTVPPGQGGATLRYFAGGVGRLGTPGAASWRATLGRFWSHEFAERIVVDPDESHVWLLTREASFVEFSTLAGGSGVQAYTAVAPSDEYRTLYFDFGTGQWELVDLDGDRYFYDTLGRWYRSEDRNGNAWEGNYNGSGQLESVDFPDGQADEFTYDTSGRLRTIARVGVGGSPSRTWTYDWAGPDLVRISYPDGRSRIFNYLTDPGYMSHQILEGNAGSPLPQRVEQAWGYDHWGNVIRAWKGAANFTDAGAVDKWELSFDDPDLPTETTVTDPLGGVSTYTIDRDSGSRKPKVLSIDGSCPVCGSAPNTSFVYDTNHPLRVAMKTSPGGVRTDYAYDAHGQITSRVDAATTVGHPHLPRITEWEHDANFPALITRVEGPTAVGGTVTRVVTSSYDSVTGNLDSRTIEGDEATYPGGGFSLATDYSSYNAAGMAGTIDPPGFGTTDQTTYTFAVAGTNGMVPDTRTDPLVGTTSFGYDAYNRRTTVTDPNNVTTTTAYDALDRVTSVTQAGDSGTPNDDRVTTYTYNQLGDLYCIKSPEGSGTEYLYDSAGRLTELRRGVAVATPTATSCLSISSTNIGERQLYTLDGAGHRTNQKLDRGTSATTWTNQSETSWVYGSMCHLDQTIQKIDASNSAVTEYAYDCQGNLERVWDPLHPRASYPAQPSTSYGYDPLDRMTSMTQPWGGGSVTTTYEYDVQDHLVGVVDGEGTETLYDYSDRDLMTAQDSEVSGVTTYAYNEHGELTAETDARLVTAARTVDAADRVTFVDYPTASLDTTYVWGTSATGWQKGRLISIVKGGSSVDYTYDPFGEVLSETGLVYTYDKNGNRASIAYPGSLLATYGYDKMNRQTWLQLKEGTATAFYLVKNSPLATYKAFGPLASLRFDLTTDRDETRTYDYRYQPTGITVSGSLLAWSYGSDAVGNVTVIDDTLASNQDRWFAYQDWQYYLNSTTGPWGSRWYAYDRTGNRLAQTLNSPLAPPRWYQYQQNAAATGNTSRLVTSCQEAGPSCPIDRWYTYDAAGNVDYFQADANKIDLTLGDDSRLGRIDRDKGNGMGNTYDGRGFLREVQLSPAGQPQNPLGIWVKPTYNSAGLLMSLERVPQALQTAERTNVLYFAGRPIGLWKKVGTAAATLTALTTDHLGTPVFALNSAGNALWYGGVEPFGRDWQEGGANDSLTKGIFLRMPGQWDDSTWADPTLGMDLFYNVHRWYEPATGRYASTDPLQREGDPHPYAYALSRPTFFADPLGLKVTNNANCLAFVKDEGTGESHALPPGQTWDGPQDGFALPCCRPCEVFKTTNGVDAELGANCSVALSGGNGLVQSLLGGWKDRGWNSGRHDKNDHGWDDTFDDACSPPKPCVPETGPDPRVRQSP